MYINIKKFLLKRLLNEAFEFIKSYLKPIKMNHNSNSSADILAKEIVIHFFLECEKCNL